VTFEPRASRVVRVRPEISGEPAEGFAVAGVDLSPTEVRIEGARREVRRRGEVGTEAIDGGGLEETVTREVKVSLTRPNVWLVGDEPIEARIRIKPANVARKR
ncbi:MAG: YbbR-like domain-containing protein, partial [Deltaproteobacteria bacterium]|nr:YbbR-like domain-containing protein [Deltaproteobacteria bacterium]